MKKKLLFALAAIVASTFMSVSAQTWSAPSFKGEVPVSDSTYYIYNVGSQGFLNRGGYWGTESVVSAQPYANASKTINMWTCVNTIDTTWTFQYTSGGSPVSGNYLFVANGANGDVYTDNSHDINWTVLETDSTNHIYSIQIDSATTGFDSTQYLGTSATVEGTNKGIANTVRNNRTSGIYTQWIFISQSQLDLYNAKMTLSKYLRYGEAQGLDISSYVTTYNSNVTADIDTASVHLLAALNRTDVTSSITNPSFETGDLSGWTNNGGFEIQNNTPQNWTKDGTYYCQKYTGNLSLVGGTITQTVFGIPNGVYGLEVSAHAVQQAGANPLHSGAFILAGNKSTEVFEGGEYYVDSVVVTNGSLTIGYSLDNATVNWVGFDNFKLYRYATSTSQVSLAASVSSLRFDEMNDSASFVVAGNNLTSGVTITTPAGITAMPMTLATNPNKDTVAVKYDGKTAVDSVITLTSGSETYTIAVKAAPNAYKPAYKYGNMIADPTFDASTLSDGGFGGWGPTSLYTKNPYDGVASAYILGSCWPNGGSMDRALTTANGNALMPNTEYRLRAMVNSQATAGTSFQFQIEGVDGSDASTSFQIPNTNGWKQIDTTFTTASTVTTGKGIYFNSCGSNTPSITDTCFIDNYEMYAVPKVYTDSASLTFTASGTQQTVAIRAVNSQDSIMLISAPVGFRVSKDTIKTTIGGETLDTITVTYFGKQPIGDNIKFTCGGITSKLLVIANVPDCYTPLYNRGNMIADPGFDSTSLSAGGFGGWGPRALTSNQSTSSYCGRSAFVLGSCWPNGGSLDRALSSANGNELKASTEYRLRAMVNSQASDSTSFQFQIEGTDGSDASTFFQIPNTNGWKQIDTTFTTASAVTTGKGIYFNSCGSKTPAVTDTCFIDNYELYAVPKFYLADSSFNFISTNESKTLNIRAENLGKDVIISVPTGFSVSMDTLTAMVGGETLDTIKVTYTGTTLSTGYLYMTSGDVKDSVMLVGNVVPTIIASPTSLTMDDVYNYADSIIVNGANLTQDIAITAPAGITVNPTTIPMSNATNVTVYVTYDKTTDSISGDITLTSDTVVTKVAVKAAKLLQTNPGTANLTHEYTFNDGTAKDVVGNADGKVMAKLSTDSATFTNKMFDTSKGGYLELPGNDIAINTYPAITLETWFKSVAGANTGNAMINYFGTSTDIGWIEGNNYLFVSPANGGKCRTAITTQGTASPWSTETGVNRPQGSIDDGMLHQLVSVVNSDSISMYVDGQYIGSASLGANAIDSISNDSAFLCKSGYGGDPTWKGYVDNFSMYNAALTPSEILYLYVSGPDTATVVSGVNIPSVQQTQKVYFQGSNLVSTFELSQQSNVRTSVYNLQGKLILRSDKVFEAGYNTNVITNALPAGLYIVNIVSNEFSVSKKVISNLVQ